MGYVALKGTFERELAIYCKTSLKLEISRPGYHPTNSTNMQAIGTEKICLKNVECTSTAKPKVAIELCAYSTSYRTCSLSP